MHVIFTTRQKTCLPITLNGLRIPHAENVKNLGLRLDCRINWKKHILNKRKQLGLQLDKIYWLLNHNCLKTSCYYIRQFSNLFEFPIVGYDL